jgi:hypothetical protein
VSVDLAKVDLLRDRLQVSYEEARQALLATNGDVVAALAVLERPHRSHLPVNADVSSVAMDVIEEVVQRLDAGPISRVRVRLGDQVIREVPVAVSIAGAIALGILAVLASRIAIDLISDTSNEEGA